MAMFSKKPLMPVSAAPSGGFDAAALVQSLAAKPQVAAGAAAGVLLITLLAVIALLGDPSASSPVVRLSLAKVTGMTAPAGWREALAW